MDISLLIREDMDIFDDFKFGSIKELILALPDEQACINFLERIFWNGEPISPFDQGSKVYKCKNNRYKCRNTGKYFNVRNIGIFKNSNVKLQDWIISIWLFTSHKGGVSSMQLQRELNLTQKTTWFILKRLRKCSGFENRHFLSNEVEIDETYIGGKNRNRHANKKVRNAQGRSSKDKVPVLGMIERKGRVVARVVKSTTKEDLMPIITRTINCFDTVYTDEWKSYSGLKLYYDHHIVNHGKKQYVNGKAHTNTIENFWGNLKRGIIGVYRVVSKKHLHYYIDEFVFRHNTRKLTPRQRFIHLITNVKDHSLSYIQLTS
ncbi:IS1595 family transposase [Flavobacterium hauense]